MATKFLMTAKEALDRRFYYRGQLRRHKNAKRKAELKEFWKAHVVAGMKAGFTRNRAQVSATDAAREKFAISASQIRRALADTAYLMNGAELKRRIRELQQWAIDQKHTLLHTERVNRYQARFHHWIQQGKPETNAHMRAVNDAADELGIDRGALRRTPRLFEIPTRRPK
jgi:hypothetical protein